MKFDPVNVQVQIDALVKLDERITEARRVKTQADGALNTLEVERANLQSAFTRGVLPLLDMREQALLDAIKKHRPHAVSR